jgi:alginate O-acetyltransferase complex protein AlgJ
MRKIFFHYPFIILLFILIFFPVTLLALHNIFNFKWDFAFTNNLLGYVENIDTPPFDIKNFTTHNVQKYYEQTFTDNLPLRSLIIRLNNQIYYLLFKKSYSYNNQIIIGNDKQLYEFAFINSYCTPNGPLYDEAYLVIWANKLKQINDFFTKNGKKFIYIITPSKAEYLPSAIPKRFHCNKHGISPHVKILEILLKERGVHYINGPELMVEATKKYKTSMFPKGGTHWNYLAGAIAANSIIEMIDQLGPPVLNSLSFDYKLSKNSEGTDSDLLNLLNLFKENKNYFVPRLTFRPSPPTNQDIKLAIIGDSFSHQILDALVKSNLFSKILFYKYFKISFEYNKNKDPTIEIINKNTPHILDSILSADIVVLEENTIITMSDQSKILYELMNKLA